MGRDIYGQRERDWVGSTHRSAFHHHTTNRSRRLNARPFSGCNCWQLSLMGVLRWWVFCWFFLGHVIHCTHLLILSGHKKETWLIDKLSVFVNKPALRMHQPCNIVFIVICFIQIVCPLSVTFPICIYTACKQMFHITAEQTINDVQHPLRRTKCLIVSLQFVGRICALSLLSGFLSVFFSFLFATSTPALLIPFHIVRVPAALIAIC